VGIRAETEIDGWLRNGGMVVTSSARAARALQGAFHRRRRSEGLAAWATPNILDWETFIRNAWEDLSHDGRVVLNSIQEQALWEKIIHSEHHLPTALTASVHRLASLAMEAHGLLCSYSPKHLRDAARVGWDQDAGAFGKWLSGFDDVCRRSDFLSPGRLPLLLKPILESGSSSRPPLLVAGFDRLLPVQRELLDTWGDWLSLTENEPAVESRFYAALDNQSELEACAYWGSRQLEENPTRRLLVITQDISVRRGEIERAFLRFRKSESAPLFEFSLGIPLTLVAIARGAHLLLRWLDGLLEESEVDWLLSSGLAADPSETAALEACMRALRSQGLQRTRWTVQSFVDQPRISATLPTQWAQRMIAGQRRLKEIGSTPKSPLEWADTVPSLLDGIAGASERTRKSAEFQAYRRWQQALDTAGSLGFDGRRVDWSVFLSDLGRAMEDTLFAPESLDAPIQIAGPVESAGLMADAVWFLGVDEGSWPAAGSMHPLIPSPIQREAGMPHSAPLRDWELSAAITKRLTSSAQVIHFSFAKQKEGTETRPSRLVAQFAGSPVELPPSMAAPPLEKPTNVKFTDFSRIPFKQVSVLGGSSVLTEQSQCPFKAFAIARLGARDWEPAEVGLTAAQRGQLLHAVLHGVWGGPPEGLRSFSELLSHKDLNGFVREHVRRVLKHEVPDSARDRMPRQYLELEEKRLVRVVTEWLAYEADRIPFTVAETEAQRTAEIAGLTVSLRLDRVDRLQDGSLLVIDYKTGDVSPKIWDLPRPDDVQLPLYAGFGIDDDLGGLVFAKVRIGNQEFAGRVDDANANLFSGLKNSSALVKDPMTAEQLIAWREYIEQLARDFLAGRAEVDPRDYPKTCEYCGLQGVCRIRESENQDLLAPENDADSEDAADE
jgi:ATP-dependent helicase/nuclease subunit B